MSEELATYQDAFNAGFTIPPGFVAAPNEYITRGSFDGENRLYPTPDGLTNLAVNELVPISILVIPTPQITLVITGWAQFGVYTIAINGAPSPFTLVPPDEITWGNGTTVLDIPIRVYNSNLNQHSMADEGSYVGIYQRLQGSWVLKASFTVRTHIVNIDLSGVGGDPDPVDPDPVDPVPTDSMIINFSGVSSAYSYAFAIGTGFITDLPTQLMLNGAITYNIPMTVYNTNTGRSQGVSSGVVSIYRKSIRIGSNWEFRVSFSVVKGSNISVNV